MANATTISGSRPLVKLSDYYNHKLCKKCFDRQVGAAQLKTEQQTRRHHHDQQQSGNRRTKIKIGRQKRNGLAANYSIAASADCYICRGLMEDLGSINEKVLAAVKNYDFETFLIGATLPTRLFEREDVLRSKLKIRGRENIKNELTRELGVMLSKARRKKRVDYLKPDITISVVVGAENDVCVTVKSRPLILFGTYIKKSRGLPQKQEKCNVCQGKGCISCDYSGLSGYDSVEGIIAKGLMSTLKGQAPKFSWIGGEDHDSLVLGSGRPFFVRIFNPRERKLSRMESKIESNGIVAKLQLAVGLHDFPVRPFVTKTKILVRTEKEIMENDIERIRTLSGTTVRFESRSKFAAKKIHDCVVERIDDNRFFLTITAEGGLAIKQFVGGEEYTQPSLSEIVGAKCECVQFDIHDVAIQ